MIASDGNTFERVDVESFNIFAGERFDFVLNASMPVGNYWIRVRGLADCGVKQAKQVHFTLLDLQTGYLPQCSLNNMVHLF